jgi:hypothetical protein
MLALHTCSPGGSDVSMAPIAATAMAIGRSNVSTSESVARPTIPSQLSLSFALFMAH